jgi:hypothetical protein
LDFKIQNIRNFLYSTFLVKLHALRNQIYNRKLPKLLSSTVMCHLFSFILKNLMVHSLNYFFFKQMLGKCKTCSEVCSMRHPRDYLNLFHDTGLLNVILTS